MENRIENQQLNITYEQLLRENEQLRIENQQLTQENEELENEIEEIESAIEQLVPMSKMMDQKSFTICKISGNLKETVEDEGRKEIISAMIAATCALGYIISLRYGVDIDKAFQLQFEPFIKIGEYFEEIGPLTSILQTSALAFCLKTFIHKKRIESMTKPFSNFNVLEEINMEEDKNVRSR